MKMPVLWFVVFNNYTLISGFSLEDTSLSYESFKFDNGFWASSASTEENLTVALMSRVLPLRKKSRKELI